MNFNRTGINSVESDEGFSVRRKSRFEIEYCESDKCMIVDVEPGEGLAIYTSSIKVNNVEKDRIINNICASLDFLDIDYIIVN